MTLIIFFLCGLLNGLMDSIKFHNSYKHWGWFFDLNSWKDLYTKPNWFTSIFGASFNAWHCAKYLMMVLFALAVCIAYNQDLTTGESILYSLSCLYFFIIGFKISYV